MHICLSGHFTNKRWKLFFLIRRVFISRLPLCTTQRIHTLATRTYYNKNNERDMAKNRQTNFAMDFPRQNKSHSLLICICCNPSLRCSARPLPIYLYCAVFFFWLHFLSLFFHFICCIMPRKRGKLCWTYFEQAFHLITRTEGYMEKKMERLLCIIIIVVVTVQKLNGLTHG